MYLVFIIFLYEITQMFLKSVPKKNYMLKVCTYMKVVSLTFKFSRGVNFVSHDPGNGFFNIFHPFYHFGLSHYVDILDERIIFLPKCHFVYLI